MNIKEFDEMTAEFLETRSEGQCAPAGHCLTDRSISNIVIEKLREFLFGSDIERAARREQYLELKKEFEGQA